MVDIKLINNWDPFKKVTTWHLASFKPSYINAAGRIIELVHCFGFWELLISIAIDMIICVTTKSEFMNTNTYME